VGDFMMVIIDYGMGNLRSVFKALMRLGIEAMVSPNLYEISKGDKLILPGVGNFKQGMSNLSNTGILDVLNERVIEQKTPILGICLGLQLFSKYSEEGDIDGIGWINAQTKKILFDPEIPLHFRVPHMGWNTLQKENNSMLLQDIRDDNAFYFIHSYHIVCNNYEDIIATTDYGIRFVSAIQKGNIFGTQFHPEKSHAAGLKILKSFSEFP
jgi:glutamine amidotransferase